MPGAAQTASSMSLKHADMTALSLGEARAAIRAGDYCGDTGGIGLGKLQGNLAILPEALALDFFRFCQRNPKPCPLVGVSDTGDPMLRTLGGDIDIRTDVPSYNVYRDGVLSEQVSNLNDLWSDDSVAFVLGCSYTFEEALMSEGIPLRHLKEDVTVPMYRSNIATTPAGSFRGPVVVSMRPMTRANAIRAAAITARFPHAHGEPVHMGDPEEIGITDLEQTAWADPMLVKDNEIPVFWACGVTPQAAIEAAKPPLFISHTPGCMLITDVESWRVAGT